MICDFAFLSGAALFLLLAACLDAQALWRLPLYAADLCLCCATLLALARAPEPLPARAALREAGRLLLLAAPLALLLFLFFPGCRAPSGHCRTAAMRSPGSATSSSPARSPS